MQAYIHKRKSNDTLHRKKKANHYENHVSRNIGKLWDGMIPRKELYFFARANELEVCIKGIKYDTKANDNTGTQITIQSSLTNLKENNSTVFR